VKRIRWNAPPSLAVIDHAIAEIEAGAAYSCTALSRAVEGFERTKHDRDLWARTHLYRTQYRRCIWGPNNQRPLWWDSPLRHYKAERIAALKKFRQACIDAAKETS